MVFRNIFFFFFLSILTASALPDSTRKEMNDLMRTRAELFKTYSNSLSKKSGFFGNQTKNDLRTAHDLLKAIVEQDNKIMDALNRSMDFRTFEKATMSFDAQEYTDRIKNLSIINDTLTKQIQQLEIEKRSLRSEINGSRFYNVVLLFVSLLFAGLFVYLNKKNKLKLPPQS